MALGAAALLREALTTRPANRTGAAWAVAASSSRILSEGKKRFMLKDRDSQARQINGEK
jgi:hypothetical protein